MTTGALVLVTDKSHLTPFYGGPRYPHEHFGPKAWAIYTPPRDTCDPRYVACTDHHPACDCREAEMAENVKELRYEYREIREAFDTFLAGHPTYADTDGQVPCQCTGCVIARAAHIYPRFSS
jgi:hypothetical protein